MRLLESIQGLVALQNFPQPDNNITQTMDVPATSVGRLIGKGGDTIRELQARSR